jgi:hypothetical protein
MGKPGGQSDYNEDARRWSDLPAFHASGESNMTWFNVLPPYIGKQPLWQYAPDPTTFIKDLAFSLVRQPESNRPSSALPIVFRSTMV